MKKIIILIVFIIVSCGNVNAWPVRGQSAFNNGKSQIGVNFLQIGNDFAFLNAMKGGQPWTYVDNTGKPSPDELTSDGYPIAGSAGVVSHGGMYTVFYVPPQAVRPGRYKITWSGNGTIYVGMNATSPTGNLTSTTGSGTYEFSTTAFRFSVGVAAVSSPAISNIQVFHVDDEPDILAGRIFGKKFKERLAEANFGVIRFLDWQQANTSNVTSWDTRKPRSYVFYDGSEFRATLFPTTVMTNSGDDFTVAAPPSWGGLVDKAMVIVRFNASASGDSATLNVGGTGAVPIRNQWGDVTSAGGNNRPTANRIASLVYDSTLNVWLKMGGDTANGDQGIVNGVPPELFLQLCIETRSHPYVVTPFLAIDPATDYMPSLANYYKINSPLWMISRYEAPNETWNNANGFYATRYGWNKAAAYGWGAFQTNDWYGKTVSVLGQIVSSVYLGDRSKYWVLAGVQTATGDNTAASDARLTSAKYVAQVPPAQTLIWSGGTINFTKSAAYNWSTHVTVAQYITPTGYFKVQDLIDGFNYVVTNAGNPSAQLAIADSFMSGMGGAAAPGNLAYFNTRYINWFAWAQNNWGGNINLGMTGYEGGYSADYFLNAWTSPITGATQTNPVVLTLATTNNIKTTGLIGNPAVVGMQITIASVGGMTQLNGNTYTVSVVGPGDSVSINVDGTGFSAYTSGGTATYVNAPLYVNTLHQAAKYATNLEGFTTDNYNNFVAAGGVFPAQFLLGGPSTNADRSTAIGTGQMWAIFDPDIWSTPSTAWGAIKAFNR